MSKEPKYKLVKFPGYVKYSGYGDDNYLHEFTLRQKSGEWHQASAHNRYYQNQPLYQIAKSSRHNRLIVGKTHGSNDYLLYIAHEIQVRVKIIKQEIYYIGELLCEARNIIKEDKNNIKINFEEWVEKNCDFSYSTALNFCRVYLVCAGNIQDIRHIKLSVLYKVCSKNFPEQLRKYLFNSGYIYHIKLKKLDTLFDAYEEIEGGVKKYEEEITKLLDLQLENEDYRLILYKIDETLSFLISKINAIGFEKRRDYYIENKLDYSAGDKIINYIYECFSLSIDTFIKLKKYLSVYYSNLPAVEPSFSKYYQYDPFELKIKYSSKVKEYVFNEKKNTITIPIH